MPTSYPAVTLCLGFILGLLSMTSCNYLPSRLHPSAAAVPDLVWSVGFLEGADNRANITAIHWAALTHIDDFGTSPAAHGTLTCDFGRHSCASPAFTNSRAALIASAHSHQVKVLMSITDLGDTSFLDATAPGALPVFVANVVRLVNRIGYDGVDIDWEANIESTIAHTQLAALLAALRSTLGSSRLLTADAIPDDWTYWAAHYALLDRVNFMAYDWEGNWNHYTWFNSALQSDPCDCVWSLDLITRRALASGIPPRKLMIGIPFYGDVSTGGAKGPRQSPPTGSYAQTTYSQVLAKYSAQLATATVDSVAKVPWFAIPNGWVQFENPSSITTKLNYIKANGLGGWSLFTLNKDASGNPLASAVETVMQAKVAPGVQGR